MAVPSRRALAIVGLLMIVFGGLGVVLGGLGVLADDGPPPDAAPVWRLYATINTQFGIAGIAINALQLAAGVLTVRDKPRARVLTIAFAALALMSTIAWLVMVFAWLAPAMPNNLGPAMGMGIVFSVLAGFVWPAVVLALFARRR
ncbi:MAG TPA: hypothetical protein VIU61_12075 [Kofleriaceae bacterium]